MEEILTIGTLRETFGTGVPAINELVSGREDDQVIQPGEIVLLSDYSFMAQDGIRDALRANGYEGSPEQVNDVLRDSGLDNGLLLGALMATADQYICKACKKAGYDCDWRRC